MSFDQETLIKKLNTFLRLIVVGLLVWPFPIAFASTEVTETETFDGTNGAQVTDLGVPSGTAAIDSDNIAIRNDQNCCGVGGQYFFSLLDGQTTHGLLSQYNSQKKYLPMWWNRQTQQT